MPTKAVFVAGETGFIGQAKGSALGDASWKITQGPRSLGMFAPGLDPVIKDGVQATNQVVISPAFLPKTCGFYETLTDIQKRCYQ